MLVNFLLAVSRRAETPTDENVLAGGGFHIQHAGKLVARYEHVCPCTGQSYSLSRQKRDPHFFRIQMRIRAIVEHYRKDRD